MKLLKKMMVVFVAALMVMSLTSRIYAEGNETATTVTPAKGTITITTPSETKADETVTYTIYKVFSAEVNETTGAVTYRTLDKGQDVPEGFTADANGYITDAPASLADTTTAFKNYSKKVSAGTATATGPSAKAVSGELDPGYYYVETSTGAAVIVTPGGKVEVEDKNELSTLVKSIGTEYDAQAKKAIAAVNSEVSFTIVVTKKHGATKLDVSDVMTNMKLKGEATIVSSTGSNPDITDRTDVADATQFTIKFASDYVKGLPDNATLTITYTAIVTSDALQTDPANNTATLTTDNNHTVEDDAKVYNAKLTITKKDENNQALAGAGFTLYVENGGEWTKVGDEIVNSSGNTFEFKGLGVGNYKVEETTVPTGYKKADDQTLSIVDKDYTAQNLTQTLNIENKKGAELPSTGGIGTTIFHIAGAALVLGAGILLISKKRMNNN